MGVIDQPPEQPNYRSKTEPKLKTETSSRRIKVKMGSRAVQNFHRRNPSQHRVLASIIDDMNKETRMKNLKMHKSRVTNVPIDVELMEVEQENLEESRRMGRPDKKVTWSRNLLQVRSISPRQKSPRTPKLSDARTSRMSEAVNTLRGGPPLTQEAAKGAKDCGHFLCQRVGGVCLQGGGEQLGGGGNLRPGFQASNTGYQASSTGHQATPGYQN